MNLILYETLFVTGLVFFFVALFYQKDWQLQIIFTTLGFIVWTTLAVSSFNIEVVVYDETLAKFITNQIFDQAFVLLSAIMSMVMLMNVFVIVGEKPWTLVNKGL